MQGGLTDRPRQLTCFSCLLDVESVRNPGQVGVHELEEVGNVLLELVSWAEVELDPSKTTNVRKHALGGT